MAKKRRLIWLQEQSKYQGGVETVSDGLIAGLAERYDITVVVLDKRPDKPLYFENPSIKTVYLGMDYLPRQDQQIVAAWRDSRFIRLSQVILGVFSYIVAGRFLLRRKIEKMSGPDDIVLASIATTYVGVPRGRKAVYHYHFNAEHYFSFLERFYRLLARRPDAEVYLSKGIEVDIKKRSKRARAIGTVIVNPIKLEPVRRIAYHGGKLVYIGRLAEQKNPMLLLRACKIMKDEGFPFSLDIYGEGKLRPEMESFIEAAGLKSHVKMHGETRDVRTALEGKDLLVLSSAFEGLPLVAGEAMSQSVPVFSTRFGATAEESIPEGTGVIVDTSDPACYAASLMKLLSDKEGLLRLREGAYAFASSHSKAAVLASWSSLLDGLR